MTPAERRAYAAGIEAVQAYAQERVDSHQARIRRDPNRRWSVTLGFLAGFGGVVHHCDQLLQDASGEDPRCL